ncbi:molybdenum cofactor guanylyltransferase [Asaia sp. VD9]|uniref:molybdenum cofactor guanylyltransferase n=1 Tax=Asaia sp. VD9 TaxID=3081235 RepID=UPI003016268C
MILAVILAGGRGSRLGGCDKPLLPLGHHSLIEEIIDRVTPQVRGLALATRPDQFGSYERFNLPVLPDRFEGLGPLCGVLSALEWGAERGASGVVTLPGDTPFIPRDFIERLMPGPACAAREDRVHPLLALWPVSCLERFHDYFEAARLSGIRRALAIRPFAEAIGVRPVSFDEGDDDPFYNINTAEDLARLALRKVS